MRNLRRKATGLAIVPAALVATSASAQDATAVQTDLLAEVATWGGVALAVIGAVAGIMIAMNFIRRAK